MFPYSASNYDNHVYYVYEKGYIECDNSASGSVIEVRPVVHLKSSVKVFS